MTGVLFKRLMRIIWKTKGQFLAVVAVVMVGIAVFISLMTAYANLTASRDSFYRATHFADYTFHVVRAPREVVREIQQVPGVVESTGRIQTDVALLRKDNSRGTARIISYTLPLSRSVNRLHLLSGRTFDPNSPGGIEVMTDASFAEFHHLKPGDQIAVVADNKKVSLRFVGTGTSAEYVYPMKDAAALLPDPESFAIIMMPQSEAEQILNMSGEINEVAVRFVPGVDQKKAVSRIKEILKPYGNLASYARKDQLSNVVLNGELDGLKANSMFMPPIFLGLAAVIQFLALGRMIKAQRMEIGVMKALGYTNNQIIAHYTGYSVMVSLVGSLLGLVAGLGLASVFTDMYAVYFKLPTRLSGIDYVTIAQGIALSLTVGILAGVMGSRRIVKIFPAEAMRPEPPRVGTHTVFEHVGWLWSRLGPAWKMSIRSVSRNRVRFILTLTGIVFAVAMLVVSLFIGDSVDYMIQKHYFQEQGYDYFLRFARPVSEGELSSIRRLSGIARLEPQLEVPVKFKYGGRSEDGMVLGMPPDQRLRALTTMRDQPIHLTENGIYLDERSAKKLKVKAGDIIAVETQMSRGAPITRQVKVLDVNRQLIGGASFASLELANRLLDEQRIVTGAVIKVDPGKAAAVEDSLKEMTGVSSIMSRQQELEGFQQQLGMMNASTAILVAFAFILGFAIVYNASIISFAERSRELATFRVIGFTVREVGSMLGNELLLQASLGILVGLPFGRIMAQKYGEAVSTDLFSIPVVIYPQTYVYAALLGLLFIIAAHVLVVRGIGRLDLVEVLKNLD